MRVLMLKKEFGAADGVHVAKYDANLEYDLPDELADAFVGMGSARKVVAAAKPIRRAPVTKAHPAAPEMAAGGPSTAGTFPGDSAAPVAGAPGGHSRKRPVLTARRSGQGEAGA